MAMNEPKILTLRNADKVFTGIGDNIDNPQILAWWTVDSSRRFTLLDGTALRAKFRDDAGDQIADDSLIILGGLAVAQVVPSEVSQVDYEPFVDLSIRDQQSERYQDSVVARVAGGGVSWGPKHRITLSLMTSTPDVSIANSRFAFPVQVDAA